MKVLVTGGAGFLGSHLCERLLDEGNEVICLDNLFTGSMDKIKHLVGNRDFSVIIHDVCSPMLFKVDQIYNLACPASPVHYQADPIGTTKTSVLGALSLLELARKTGARVLQASTSEVYGDPLEHPQSENYWGNVNPIGERSCYDEGKRCAESLFFDYNRVHDVDTRVVRIFNTYGPRMEADDGRVVSNFITQALAGRPLTIYGDGTQTRSFCYVDDLISGLITVMNSQYQGPVNLGNPNEVTMLELVEEIGRLLGKSLAFGLLPLPSDDPKKRKPDIALAKSLGWEPKVSLEDGIHKTISYFMKRQ